MGSIVARCALQNSLPHNLGRVVLLCPPNGGSHVATRLAPLYSWICRAVTELGDRADSFVNRLPPAPDEVDIGVLAAARDRVIHLDRTHLSGQRDHHVIQSWHTGVLWRPETADHITSFLRTGRFATNASLPHPAPSLST